MISDAEFLVWLHGRMIMHYHEDSDVDFVQRVRKMAEEAQAREKEPIPTEAQVYTLDRLTMMHLHTILRILAYEKQVTVKLNQYTGTNVIDDWHQIELAVIAAHERRVRGQ